MRPGKKASFIVCVALMLLVCVALLNHTSHFISVKSVKIHKGLCVTGGRLYHVFLEVSAA